MAPRRGRCVAAWVADIDFPVAAPVRAALHELVDSAALGYPDWPAGTPLRGAFAARMQQRFGWAAAPERVCGLTDLIQGVQLVLHLATDPGGSGAGHGGRLNVIAVHPPTYPPFLSSIRGMGRRLLPVPMLADDQGWGFDPDRFAGDVAAAGCQVLLLVNPQIPTGRVFTPHGADRARRDRRAP